MSADAPRDQPMTACSTRRARPDLRCPGCGGPVESTGSGPAMLSRDQWDAVKAGDFYCAGSCEDLSRENRRVYFSLDAVLAASICEGPRPPERAPSSAAPTREQAPLDAVFLSAINMARTQHTGSHEQDRWDAMAWMELFRPDGRGRCTCKKCEKLWTKPGLADAGSRVGEALAEQARRGS